MLSTKRIRAFALGGSALITFSFAAVASEFNVPSGDLKSALKTYAAQSGVQLVVSAEAIRGVRSNGVQGELSAEEALGQVLAGTGFSMQRRASGSVAIVPTETPGAPLVLAQASPPPRAAVETVTVTSSKLGGADVQSIPIAITALSQEQLTATQTAGGPDLVKQVPNMTFTKTNFTGYSIQIRGIGTQAISVTTDPAVAVSFNDTPFIRNHFFEQEFYDVGQVEVLRGPQGTLYGRNATAGVVNLVSAKPTDQFEAMASADIGNYHQRRFEGMLNLPISDDRLDIRLAGEWTKRQGYSFNEYTDNRIDGRDLWSTRVTIGFKPMENLQTYLIWEHFSEGDDRIRSGKQLCKTDYGPGGTPTNGTVSIDGTVYPVRPGFTPTNGFAFTQGCLPESLYSPESFEAPLGYTLPYVTASFFAGGHLYAINPYASTTQSQNLRVINSSIDPIYKAKNDVIELNSEYAMTPAITLTSQTGYSQDFLYSAEDYNRFGAAPGLFNGNDPRLTTPDPSGLNVCADNAGPFCSTAPLGASCPTADGGGCLPAGVFCDPQLGCSNRLVAEDLSEEHAWQVSQEFRLASNFSGPFNFSVGGNYLHYETVEDYYVFINTISLFIASTDPCTTHYVPGVTDNSDCLPMGFQYNDPAAPVQIPGSGTDSAAYLDPNPLSKINGNGHNYFRSRNPYVLNSYAAFGEAYYNIASDLKLTTGLRWTVDQKHFLIVPSWLADTGWGYPVVGAVNQNWGKATGRAVLNWTPKLAFTDQTLVYNSYSHGYKAGGANPPGAKYSSLFEGQNVEPVHPLTFKPEFVDAFELGTKNTLFDGGLTLNGDVFYYDYKGYQISEIVDRTAINHNYNAKVKGAEIESTWEPLPGLRFNFSGGYEDTRLDNGQSEVDLIDRTAGHPDWYLVKPFINESSNCIFPGYVAKNFVGGGPTIGGAVASYCTLAYNLGLDPLTNLPYVANPTVQGTDRGNCCSPLNLPGYVGFDPSTAPNDGEGFSKDLGGHELPNAPPFTVSAGAQYTLPLTSDWAGTARVDYYWQDYSWARVFNDNPYDRLRGYTNVNLTLILTSQAGWQVMLYDKNIFNTTAVTGDFLNSDDSGLTTNVFLTDPRLIGVRITKNW